MTNPAADLVETTLGTVASSAPTLVNRLRLQPGPRHPITVEPAGERVVVSVGGRVIADTRDALVVREADYAPVHYLPRQDVDLAALERSAHTSYCPFKGEAVYFHVIGGGDEGSNAVWSYEEPYEALAPIAGHLAFYANRVEIRTSR